jgi:hypothetical protein
MIAKSCECANITHSPLAEIVSREKIMPASVPWSLRLWIVVVGVYCTLMFLSPWQPSSFPRGGRQSVRQNQVEAQPARNLNRLSSAPHSMSPAISSIRGDNSPAAVGAAKFARQQ